MTAIDMTKLDGIMLKKGGHQTPEQGMCLMEQGRTLIRFRSDGVPAKGLPTWVRVFGRCEQRGDCWEFTGTPNEDGYGHVRHDGRMVGAHRVAFEVATGLVPPPKMDVCHRCDNPHCCNPAHLFLGTHADNNADRHAKGRTLMPTNGPDYQRIKTHCPYGHPYSGTNVRYRTTGARYCGECYRDRTAAYAATNRDQINARRRANRPSRAKRSA